MCLTVFRTLRRLVSSSSIRDILLKTGCAAGIACLCCLACFPTEATAQGVSPITKEQYASIPRWQPDPRGVGEMPRVDLREFLPPVGNQGRNNDCVAWAVGYACKTYMETRQNKWNPVEINHQFSPSFVYNLLNSGHDRGLGSLVVRGRAFFNDGRVREVQQRFQFARASRRNLRLAFTDRYFGRISDQPKWEWTVQVKGSLAEIADIRQVIYHLHPTFPTPDRAVAGTPENGFAFTTIGWGGFPLRATLYFKDSSTAELNGAVQFRDPVRNELSLKNVARPSGTSISIPK